MKGHLCFFLHTLMMVSVRRQVWCRLVGRNDLLSMNDLRMQACSCLFLFGVGVLAEALHNALPKMLQS